MNPGGAPDPAVAGRPLRVAFVCGCAEGGANGVGDYTAALAGALRGRGVDARIAAVSDPFVAVPRPADPGPDGAPAPLCRLPAAMSRAGRTAALVGWLDAFLPDWISIQFVPYAFHPKGLVDLGDIGWDRIGRRARTHVCFHEIWIGAQEGAPARDRFWGAWQRRGILRAVRLLRPRAIHTSNPLYRRLLERSGVPASILPLFGNIPVTDAARARARERDRRNRAEGVWLGGFFGFLNPGFPAQDAFTRLARHAAVSGRRLRIAGLGRSGPSSAAAFGEWARRWPGIGFDLRGEMPAGGMSEALAGLDFGLATTPLNVIGKSGSAAAQVEHGVPVVCAAPGTPARGAGEAAGPRTPGIWSLADFLAHPAGDAPRPPIGNRLPEIAERLHRLFLGKAGP